ncbi:hypothetical protein B0H13DRAFT_1881534 [Mycena leptocephala]|nr:hypothetical protein B0H13DRAFT_1881534 [Mycena leptocephala]
MPPATHHPVATQLVERLNLTGSSILLGPADASRFEQEIHVQLSCALPPDAGGCLHLCAAPQYTVCDHVANSRPLWVFRYGPMGRDLYKLHAERLAKLDFAVDVHNGMECAIVLILFLIVYSDHYHRNVQPLPATTESDLIQVLRSVKNIYSGNLQNAPVPSREMFPDLMTQKIELRAALDGPVYER